MNKENNKLTKSEEQKLEEWRKKMEDDNTAMNEGKKFLMSCCKTQYDIDEKLKKISRELQSKIQIQKEDLNEDEMNILKDSLYGIGIDNGYHLIEITPDKLQVLVNNLRGNLIKEFNCTTYAEKMLIDTIINSYIRNLNYSKKLLNTTELGKTSPEINGYIKEMSKEIDRANRHFLSSLQTLKELKQPDLKVNIKANTAFFGKKQEFNNKKE